MTFSGYTIAVTYFVAAVGLVAASLVEGLGSAFIALAALAMTAAFVVTTRSKLDVPHAAWNILAVLILALFIFDYLAVSRSLVVAAARFLSVLVVLKLFDLKRTKDYMALFALVFFQLLAAAASTTSPVFFAVLALFIMCAIWAMIIFNIKRDWEEHHRGDEAMAGEGDVETGPPEPPRSIFGPSFLAGTVALTIVAMAMTLVLFFLIPRMAVGFFEKKTLNTVKVAGFSDKIDLGDIGPVKLDPTVIMRVEIRTRPKGGLPPLHFRGTTFDKYNGTGWERSSKKLYPAEKERRGKESHFIVGKWPGGVLEQRILLEPLDTETLFAASRGVAITGKFAKIMIDDTGSIYVPATPYSRLEYTAWSAVSYSPVAFGAAPGAATPYLQTPYGDASPIDALAAEITTGAESALEKAQAVERYLETNYSYSLSPATGAGENPLEDFLIYTKEGWCEHYATAMAVLLRHSGVASRIVTGFLEGQWNDYGGYFLVRQQDAHTWVEAYIPGTGWVTFDPTPAAGLTTPLPSSGFSLLLDSMRWRWTRYIVNFTQNDQMRMAGTVESGAAGLRRSLKAALASLLSGGGATGATSALLAIVGAAAAAVVIYFVLAARRIDAGRSKAPSFYKEMAAILKRAGFERAPSETAMEFAQRTGFDGAVSVTWIFERVRYGETELTEAQSARVSKEVAALKEASELAGRGVER